MITYGTQVQAPYVFPHPTKRGEYDAEMRPAVVVGFSHPNLVKRGWGWMGSMLVEFHDGKRSWTRVH
jgi:hypothetical protein